MHLAFTFASFLPLIGCARITSYLQNGVCLCVNEPNVKAVRDPQEPNSQVAILSNGACFHSNGGIYHSNGNTWYELLDTSNGQKGWVNSFYLNVFLMNVCNNSANIIKPAFHTPSAPPADCNIYGIVYSHGEEFTVHNMACICDDGAALCSLRGKHCLSGGIVYQDGHTFSTTSGVCNCTQGTVTCGNTPIVGK